MITSCTVQVTLAGPTVRVAEITKATRITVGRSELGSALTLTSTLRTVTSGVESVTFTRYQHTIISWLTVL